MKYQVIIIVAALFSLCHSIHGQVSIYNSHYFKEGLTVKYQPTYDSLIVYEDYGQNQIWDYLHINSKGKPYGRQIKSASDTPLGSQFSAANFAIVGDSKDHVYLNVREDKTEFIAFVPPDTSYFVHNYQPWSISIHPFMFGDSVSAPISRYIQIGERVIYRQGEVVLSAIGSGTLMLPSKTYSDVLKIKEVQTFYNPARTTFYQATSYHWLSNEHNFPILSCNEIIDRNSKGEEDKTRFAQYLVSESNTNQNIKIRDIIQSIEKVQSQSVKK